MAVFFSNPPKISSASPMASVPRKLLSATLTITISKPPCPLLGCFNFCDCVKPPPLPSDVPVSPEHRLISTSMTIMACLLSVFFVMGIVFTAARLYYLRRIQSRTPNPPILFHTHDDFAGEDLAGGHPHPIWLINFVGLQRTVIDSITVCKYRSGEGLIEGTECSVCLGDFEEDESLRLLPKCNHAFHLPCIDTWLTSHQNCPLCRAPIVSAAAAAAPEAAADSAEETQLESSGGARTEIDVIGDDPIRRNGDSRALSDLSDKRRVGSEVMRRSVSMDSSWASIADLGRKIHSNSVRRSSFKRSGTRLCRLVKSASFVQKKPVSMKTMKRSCSSQNCRSRSQESLLSL